MKHYSTYQSQFIEMFKDSPKSAISDFCKVEKGTTITRNEVIEGNIPVVAGGQEPSCYHNVANRKAGVITISASGAYSGFVNYWTTQIFASDCNTIIPIDEKNTNVHFLYHGLKAIQREIYSLQKGGAQPHVYGKDIEKFLFPYPTKEEQDKFADIAQQADKSKFAALKSQFIEMFGNPLSSVQRYPLKKLGDCCELNPRRPNLTLKETDKVSFVPMPSVSENGYLQDVVDEEYGKVKKGFTYFENNDVLFAKITPCMENGKGAIAEGLTNNIGMGSTEFHVLRPIEGVSSPYWLLALTRLPIFRERASKNMTGTGGQKRVPTNYLENFMVGLPSIEEQNWFENIYKQADKSKYIN